MRKFWLVGVFVITSAVFPLVSIAAPAEIASTKESFKLPSDIAKTAKPKTALRSSGGSDPECRK